MDGKLDLLVERYHGMILDQWASGLVCGSVSSQEKVARLRKSNGLFCAYHYVSYAWTLAAYPMLCLASMAPFLDDFQAECSDSQSLGVFVFSSSLSKSEYELQPSVGRMHK